MPITHLFHVPNLDYPGVRHLHRDPDIIAIDHFASDDECDGLAQLYARSHGRARPSATAPGQEALRTSTTVFPDELEVRWLRERIAQATNIASLEQLEPTKLTRYAAGEYFRKHIDASFLNEKMWAYAARLAGVDEDGVQAPCSWPSRFVTLFLYLNDVDRGGRTRFRWLDGSGSMPGGAVFTQSIEALAAAADAADASSVPITALPHEFRAHHGADASSVPGTAEPPATAPITAPDEPQGSTSVNELPATAPAFREPASELNIKELNIKPIKGTAILHFPSTRQEFGCVPDPRTMHESEPALDEKLIVQQFIWPVPLRAPSAADGHGFASEAQGQAQGQAEGIMWGAQHGAQHEDVRAEWAAILAAAGSG
eukprot:jgi/Chrpa1/3519/Chrysochromulina_OHIO_Genome00006916-RA